MEPEPQPGDLIEIFRAGYQHWGVCVGDGDIVHFVNPNCLPSSSGLQSVLLGWVCRGEVRKGKLKEVVRDSRWQINNKLDKTYRPRPTQQIVKDALSFVGEKALFCVHLRNCEHFATKLRYGKAVSWQVIKAVAEAVFVAGAAAAGAAIAGPAGAAAAATAALLVVKNPATM
ncbi:phospholipase A and acyltransferase 4-like [Toxotes jaculatrix]|uniref:phospholipase A and acyltransferase 4-like n=1 Tax=Toxotes jaculatrix TaxID=941984 RepID=UPI001B3AAA02|nr:phospholipase A and acyltransferase 4-like [Toxotes jaculatrix]XP_040904873.1 phospholipase A and acyltransferase 4-like [Toxotes jaculatrix]XP_040904874.1 phospholipase A and acyltransferase 4-like [Toxotes jaculatrix]XP_040904875.1 phospholipase A and acyltransferase 4-like [Toxotes jaculatrix]XP_040904876.1 phospholipase A and acyltransferase 4-like [Toxotes jaculatrix]XP_040904877.1 phospholipase A and acyltransferase 4-like [Toxotes jaculatrix]XP_040904878.1 phospholipase A and acyltr